MPSRATCPLVEVQARLIERGALVGIGTVHHFFVRHGITRKKKTVHAIEQDRPNFLRQRHHWLDGQIDEPPERLVFIDEMWTATNMSRSHGRYPKGERRLPHRHHKTTTLVAGLPMTGMVARIVLDGLAPQGGRANRQWPLGPDRQARRHLPAR